MPTDIVDRSDASTRIEMIRRLWDRQSRRCFICDELIDLQLHADELDVDHIHPTSDGGSDEENNKAVTHLSCNRSKGAADLRVARRMAEFERLQRKALEKGEKGVNLGHVLDLYGGAKVKLRLVREDSTARFVLGGDDGHAVTSLPIYRDPLSGMDYCFAVLPLTHLHHDDRINPRNIGPNLRGLIEEFMKRMPQLHVALAWWAADPPGGSEGAVKVFDGQHKAAAQVMLGVTRLPVRIFLSPNTDVLLQANTNAGDKLAQVAFDKAVLRHLGSTLFVERVRTYQTLMGLAEDDLSFTEKQLANFFAGERKSVERYIVDAVRDGVTNNKDNRLLEFVEWAGKGSSRPLSYNSLEKTFFSEFLYSKALDTGIGASPRRGDWPRRRTAPRPNRGPLPGRGRALHV